MRPDTRTTPPAAVNSTPPLSAKIEALDRELHIPYPWQPGEVEVGDDWGRCACAGGTSVLPATSKTSAKSALPG